MSPVRAPSVSLRQLAYPMAYSQQIVSPVPQGCHALILASPFNSYFSRNRVCQIVSWCVKAYEQVDVFVADQLSVYTLTALGYDKTQAERKARLEGNRLRRKALVALEAAGAPQSEARVFGMERLGDNEVYRRSLERVKDAYSIDKAFRKECGVAARAVLRRHEHADGVSPRIGQVKIAEQYLIDETPLLIDGPSIFHLPAMAVVYHRLPEYWRRLYAGQFSIRPDPRQEFVVLRP